MSTSESTPDAILRVAADLFSRKGFHGTSTREIADGVGIRQPSLFHHFASKTEIARALFEYDYQRSPALRGEDDLLGAEPAVRLYAFVRREVLIETTSRYDLRGLYLTSLTDEPEFAKYRRAYDQALERGRTTLTQGVASGDFIDSDLDLVVEIFDAVVNQAVRWTAEKRDPGTPDAVAAMMLRMVLVDPSRIPAIARAADELVDIEVEPRP